MKETNQLDIYRKSWIIPGYSVKIDSKTKEEIDWINQTIKDFDMRKPALAEIKTSAQEKNISIEKLKLYMGYLTQQNLVVHYKNEFIHRDVIDRMMKQILTFLQSNSEGYYLAEIREITGMSKKLAPIMMEYFEEEGFVTISDYNRNSFNSKITDKGKGAI